MFAPGDYVHYTPWAGATVHMARVLVALPHPLTSFAVVIEQSMDPIFVDGLVFWAQPDQLTAFT